MNVRRKGGDLDREIEAGKRSGGPDIAEGGGGLLRERGGDRVEHVEVALEEAGGLRLVDHGFAKQVDGGGQAGPGILAQLFHEVLRAVAGDELPRHVHDLRFHGVGDERRGKGGRGKARLEGGMKLDGLVAEVFLEMPDDLRGRVQGRQHIDKAEELRFECRILHRPFHEARVGAFLGEDAGNRMGIHEPEELVALGANRRLDLRIKGQKPRSRTA